MPSQATEYAADTFTGFQCWGHSDTREVAAVGTGAQDPRPQSLAPSARPLAAMSSGVCEARLGLGWPR